ncbi:uncharacterized protein NPIL_144341 [Nephila pilipes]|uniref:Uncharacterized protein n=1 Tax=Nephila pilipes TaxID=299642 RepID=A0A8X6P7D7_NEPPI|nr:uncharacterized protein NPIL_144341 [Nephila pilipes]
MDEEEQRGDVDFGIYTWLNKAFDVPPKQLNPRAFYPWSSSLALEYRSKLAIVLLNLAAALFLVERPCDQFGVLFNCSLVFLLCDILYRNYPWRQPLKNHLWRLLRRWPTAQVSFCFVMLAAFRILKEACALSGASLCFLIGWTGFLTSWFFTRKTWKHAYDFLEKERPVSISFSSYIEHCVLLIISSIFYPAFYSACLYAILGSLFFTALWLDLFANQTAQYFILSFFIVTCLKMVIVYLQIVCKEATREWEDQEMLYSNKVVNHLWDVVDNLSQRSEHDLDAMAVAVPFLQQEALILQNAKYVDKEIKDVLQRLIKEEQIEDFQKSLHDYTPYSAECCIS